MGEKSNCYFNLRARCNVRKNGDEISSGHCLVPVVLALNRDFLPILSTEKAGVRAHTDGPLPSVAIRDTPIVYACCPPLAPLPPHLRRLVWVQC